MIPLDWPWWRLPDPREKALLSSWPQCHPGCLHCLPGMRNETAPLKLRVLQLLSVSETSHFFYLWCWCCHLLRVSEKAECSIVSLILSRLHTPGAHWDVNHLDHFHPLHMSPLLPAPERKKSSFLYFKNYPISCPQISYIWRMTWQSKC